MPGSGESLPVIGLGSSKVVEEIAKNGEDPLRQVMRTLVAHGGKVIDTWPRNPENDGRFGTVINEAEFRDRLFVTSKIDRAGKDAGIAQLRQAHQLYGRKVLDLAQIFSLTDVDTHWPTLREWKDSGHDALHRRHRVRAAAPRRPRELPQAREAGHDSGQLLDHRARVRGSNHSAGRRSRRRGDHQPAVHERRLFKRLEGRPLPQWATEFGCTTWAEFSLKYILSNPRVTVVLTETSNPKHMEENTQAALGPMPDESARKRMREFITTV